jgi:hypothetical protein
MESSNGFALQAGRLQGHTRTESHSCKNSVDEELMTMFLVIAFQ